MICRRTFLGRLAGGLLTARRAAEGQQRPVPRIGILAALGLTLPQSLLRRADAVIQ